MPRLLLVCLLLVTSALVVLSGGSTAGAAASAQERLDQARSKLQQRQARAQVLTTDIDAYDARIATLERRVGQLNADVDRVDTRLAAEEAELEGIRRDLRRQRARATRLKSRLGEARALLAGRLVELYQADKPDMVTVVLNSDGFADLLEREQFLSRIASSDRKIVVAVRVARTDAVQQSRRLDAAESRQRTLTASVQRRRDALASMRQEVVDVRAGARAARGAKREALAGVQVQVRQTASEVRSLAAAQARVQRRLAAAARRQAVEQASASASASPRALPAAPVRGGGGGAFIWPVNGTITSPFCEQRSYESCHPGLDIAAPEGTPIRATAAGKVVLLQSVAASGGYGNYTCIQHSGGVSSCYAHQVRFGTSLGASVGQGDVIGYVGNTGRSFGAHLHWEVRVGGAVRNPLDYL